LLIAALICLLTKIISIAEKCPTSTTALYIKISLVLIALINHIICQIVVIGKETLIGVVLSCWVIVEKRHFSFIYL